jgi:hypothetical protein
MSELSNQNEKIEWQAEALNTDLRECEKLLRMAGNDFWADKFKNGAARGERGWDLRLIDSVTALIEGPWSISNSVLFEETDDPEKNEFRQMFNSMFETTKENLKNSVTRLERKLIKLENPLHEIHQSTNRIPRLRTRPRSRLLRRTRRTPRVPLQTTRYAVCCPGATLWEFLQNSSL